MVCLRDVIEGCSIEKFIPLNNLKTTLTFTDQSNFFFMNGPTKLWARKSFHDDILPSTHALPATLAAYEDIK